MSTGQKRKSRRIQGQEPEAVPSPIKRKKGIIKPGQLLSGVHLKDVKLYKILNKGLVHYGFRYKEGLNELIGEFRPQGDCTPGGLYVTSRPERWVAMGTHIAPVSLPDDARVWTGNAHKFKVDKLVLGTITPIPYDIYLAAVEQNELQLHQVPEQYRTEKLCRAAIQYDGYDIEYVPKVYHTPQLYYVAAQQNGFALVHMSDKEITPEIYLVAVQNSGPALKYVPLEHRTPNLCLSAVKQSGLAILYVPEKERSPELCLCAVQNDGEALRYIPIKQRTALLCTAAVKQSPAAVRYVPDCHKNFLH